MGLPRRELVDHRPGRAQHWRDADQDLRWWIDTTVDRLAEVPTLIAVWLHGSLSTGTFHRPTSDVDVLVVVDDPLDDLHRRNVAAELLEAHDRRPIVGGIELSVVRRRSLEPFVHPMPYELHFSEVWADDVRAGGTGPSGTDRDLAAHCAATRQRGLAMLGPDPSTLIGTVPHDAVFDAVMDDLRWIVDGGIIESPVYGVLNICRSAQMALDDPTVLASKEEGARWALEHLPDQHRRIVSAAVACYRSAAVVSDATRRCHGHRWNQQPLLELAAWVRDAVRPHT